jgi:uncharacterized protein YxjI
MEIEDANGRTVATVKKALVSPMASLPDSGYRTQ